MLKAVRVVLDPNKEQEQLLRQHCGASRWAYNYALGKKVAVHKAYSQERAALTYEIEGTPEEALKEAVKSLKGDSRFKNPNYMTISKEWTQERGDQIEGVEGVSPWWKYGPKRGENLARYAFISAFQDADAAWKNWLDSLSGKRKGKASGYPRFKKKNGTRDSYTLYHDKKKPTIRPEDARHLNIPNIGIVHTTSSMRKFYKQFAKGRAEIGHITLSRSGTRWIASVLIELHQEPQVTSRHQKSNGSVGVDLGVKESVITSDGVLYPNPRYLKNSEKRLKQLQRDLARCEKGSHRRQRTVQKISKQHALVAEQRKSYLNQITKVLATHYQEVCIEDLNVSGMTSTAKGTLDNPGKMVRQKAGLNRAILDVSFGEFRRQLEYKSSWYGSTVKTAHRFAPTSKRCFNCGNIKKDLTLSDRVYKCSKCNYVADRDINAALNIMYYANNPEALESKSKTKTLSKVQDTSSTQTFSDRGNPRSQSRVRVDDSESLLKESSEAQQTSQGNLLSPGKGNRTQILNNASITPSQ